jgi:hypothetical protein
MDIMLIKKRTENKYDVKIISRLPLQAKIKVA